MIEDGEEDWVEAEIERLLQNIPVEDNETELSLRQDHVVDVVRVLTCVCLYVV